MDNAPDGLHLATITITLTDDADTEHVAVDADEGTSTTTLLGILELARAQILDQLT